MTTDLNLVHPTDFGLPSSPSIEPTYPVKVRVKAKNNMRVPL